MSSEYLHSVVTHRDGDDHEHPWDECSTCGAVGKPRTLVGECPVALRAALDASELRIRELSLALSAAGSACSTAVSHDAGLCEVCVDALDGAAERAAAVLGGEGAWILTSDRRPAEGERVIAHLVPAGMFAPAPRLAVARLYGEEWLEEAPSAALLGSCPRWMPLPLLPAETAEAG